MAKQIQINTWYNCQVDDSLELCKIVRRYHVLPNNVGVATWVVVCYYTGKDLFAGSLSMCRQWIEKRYIYG